MDKQIAEILVHLNAMWRRRWLAIAVALVTCVAGWASVALIPNTYTSAAQVYVDTQTVLAPLLKGITVEDDFDAEVAIMQQTLLSRPNLAEVARATDLDLTVSGPSEMESLIKGLGERTEVSSNCQNRRRSRQACNLFTITFQDTQPQRAKAAVQSLLNIFMEGQLGESRTEMDSARRFIDEQILDYQRQLDLAEQRLAEFKQENMLHLPGPNSFRRRMERLDEAYADITARLEGARTQHNVLLQQLSDVPAVVATSPDGAFGSGPPSDYSIRILELEAQLDKLLTNYTAKHPDVQAIQRRLAQLKAEQQREEQRLLAAAEALEAVETQRTTDGKPIGPEYGTPNPAYSGLRLMVAEKEAEVASLEEQVARLQAKREELQNTAHEMLDLEAELAKLTRDYDVIKDRYEALLSRRESAKIAREREARGEKVQFRVVEPPEVPIKPSGPPRLLLLTAVLPVGFGAGVAVTFVLAALSRTFVDPRRLGEDMGLPVLGSVSMIDRASDQRWKWIDTGIFVLAVAAMLALYALLMLVEQNVGFGRVVGPAMEVTSVGELISFVEAVLDQALAPLGE